MNLIDFDSFDFENPSMKIAVARLKKSAQANHNTLLLGKAGVGKSTMALYCHHLKSPDQNIMFVEAKTFQWEVVKSEMTSKKIKTLVLENLEQLSPDVPLAFFSEMKTLGVQVIATSQLLNLKLLRNFGLSAEVLQSLSEVTILVPSLAERREDILEITSFLLDVFCILYGSEKKTLADKALAEIYDYSWPENIRELEVVLEKAFSQSVEKIIRTEDLKLGQKNVPSSGGELAGMSLSEVEKRLILQTLELTKKNKSKAAQLLGISIRTLRNKLTEYKESGVVL